ncbi:hypothetical protein [Pseudobacteriovorax antillogorgiicola]|uniref:Beta-barrel porin 2 n=1 Tax=Pseudobacteriovorax antillogorgiicola TaxID=1513793 RepID=A0A1Y6BJW2_9BACT|nr:hypothetical protein [Pseudobacteriovorax antillogorgiicola]TCS55372.1 hypothetical protein EDD56_10593 [Pseudobacteriovorax antillogorgiicola]SMF13430.1 hypothetical protein SAMN06296036_105231 [Pseudobacteriovorax antillogorgiicola]
MTWTIFLFLVACLIGYPSHAVTQWQSEQRLSLTQTSIESREADDTTEQTFQALQSQLSWLSPGRTRSQGGLTLQYITENERDSEIASVAQGWTVAGKRWQAQANLSGQWESFETLGFLDLSDQFTKAQENNQLDAELSQDVTAERQGTAADAFTQYQFGQRSTIGIGGIWNQQETNGTDERDAPDIKQSLSELYGALVIGVSSTINIELDQRLGKIIAEDQTAVNQDPFEVELQSRSSAARVRWQANKRWSWVAGYQIGAAEIPDAGTSEFSGPLLGGVQQWTRRLQSEWQLSQITTKTTEIEDQTLLVGFARLQLSLSRLQNLSLRYDREFNNNQTLFDGISSSRVNEDALAIETEVIQGSWDHQHRRNRFTASVQTARFDVQSSSGAYQEQLASIDWQRQFGRQQTLGINMIYRSIDDPVANLKTNIRTHQLNWQQEIRSQWLGRGRTRYGMELGYDLQSDDQDTDSVSRLSLAGFLALVF